MVHALLKPLLKRGALVAAANWQVTLAQATADSLFKLLVATPVVGGIFLVALVIGAEPRDLMALEWREMVTTVITSLLSHPLVLLSFLLSLGTVVIGGSLFVFFVKAGTIAVLVEGERKAGEIGESPLHLDDVARAGAFTPELFIASAQALFGRYAGLGVGLMLVYSASAIGYLFVVLVAGVFEDAWGLAALSTIAFVVWITVVNLFYLLMQIVIATEDCSLPGAVKHVTAFMARMHRQVAAVFGVVLLLVVMATGVSFLATFALGLIGFVPFVGLAVLPIQLLAWLFRGLLFQFLGLASVGAYLRLYRDFSGQREIRRIAVSLLEAP
jgi:hypothetical protein